MYDNLFVLVPKDAVAVNGASIAVLITPLTELQPDR
jgi:hypothetical protein